MLEPQETWVQSLGLQDSSGEGSDNPLQYSCLESPMDRGAWGATAHGVQQSQTRLNDWACPHGTVGLVDDKPQWKRYKNRMYVYI